jgi:hypothetical protein
METWKKLHQRSCGWRRSRDWPVKLGRSKGESGRTCGLARFTLAICCIQVCLLALWIEWVFRVSSSVPVVVVHFKGMFPQWGDMTC